MLNKTVLSSMAIVSLLSACSGGSGSSQSFDQLATKGQNIIEKYQDADLTPEAAMPTSGTATYNGVAAFSDVPDAEYIAENAEAVAALRLEANFGNNTISGKMDNFVDYDNERADGSVQITNGSISGNTFNANLNGSLTVDGDTASVTGDMAGGFVGANANAVAGVLQADLSAGGQTGATLYGIFGAER
jgi:hypothetical protein